ncbi:hypothetical protein LAZ67_11001960 [Cordylochernes scorpioides]|uniref:Uncharacterized protein n=1 Tax=Cordylochernes scorpioides TaxID=51811 RepID=A0ABY6L133_9ARAC|nr:hypothetical protein LAZ67_11001960 [Cordylochernes scorpioides]
MAYEGYSWTKGSREAFVLLNEERKLHQLPAKRVIISKGELTPAYITTAKCHRQGHRRATCPFGNPQSRPAQLQDNQSGPLSTFTASQPTSSQNPAAPISAAMGPDTTRQTTSRPSSPATSSLAANLSIPPQVTLATESSDSAPNANRLTPLQAPSSASSLRSSVKTLAPAPTTTTAAPPPAASDHPAPEAAPVQRPSHQQLIRIKPPGLHSPTAFWNLPMPKLKSLLILRPLDYDTETIVWAVFDSQDGENVLVSPTPKKKFILVELLDCAIASVGNSDHFITQKLSVFKVACEAQFQTFLH